MRRILHYVVRVGNLMDSLVFYMHVLGMKVLRHEEFDTGCEATCNGPYKASWTKTMIGYGAEDDHFALEIVHNEGVSKYKIGNFHAGFYIDSPEAFSKCKALNCATSISEHVVQVTDPDGYVFFIANKRPKFADPFQKVSLHVSNLNASLDYYCKILAMKCKTRIPSKATVVFSDEQCELEFVQLESCTFDNGDGCGRVAFSCPVEQLKGLQELIKSNSFVILTPLINLHTDGKATVSVVILADPDGHEICFVGDEAFRELSKIDPESNVLWTKKLQAYVQRE